MATLATVLYILGQGTGGFGADYVSLNVAQCPDHKDV